MSLGLVAYLDFQPTICLTVPHAMPCPAVGPCTLGLRPACCVLCLCAWPTCCARRLGVWPACCACGLGVWHAYCAHGLGVWPACCARCRVSCLHAVRCLCAGSVCCARGRGRVGLQPMRAASVNGQQPGRTACLRCRQPGRAACEFGQQPGRAACVRGLQPGRAACVSRLHCAHCLPSFCFSWAQGRPMEHAQSGHVWEGLTNPPPPAEVDALIDLFCRYSCTCFSNCHKVVSLSHVASEISFPFHFTK